MVSAELREIPHSNLFFFMVPSLLRSGADDSFSVSLSQSFQDWWNSAASLRKPFTPLDSYYKDRLQNIKVQYNLFRSVLSKDILLVNPVNNEPDTPSTDYLGEFTITKIDDLTEIFGFKLKHTSSNSLDVINLVLIHGYMAASGYFATVLEDLIKSNKNLVIHLIDLPGFGNSSRPKFPESMIVKRLASSSKIDQIHLVEDWFTDRIEEWRILNKIDSFHLIGHSMGAYLACCYLLKYNTQENSMPVKHVMLVSPMGTESSAVSLLDPIESSNSSVSNNEDFISRDNHSSEEHLENNPLREFISKEDAGKPKFPTNFVLKYIWENQLSPFQVLQYMGPLFSKFLSIGSKRRFRNLENKSIVSALHKYSYSISNQYPYSGEIAITKLVNHEILAYLPLCDRGLIEYLVKNKIHNTWLYGDKDWMNDQGGLHIFNKIKALDEELSGYKIIEHAGHHIYLDNSEDFVKCCIDHFSLN